MHGTFRPQPLDLQSGAGGPSATGLAGRAGTVRSRVVSIAGKAFERLAEERALVSARLGGWTRT